jgi:hypothetical protein
MLASELTLAGGADFTARSAERQPMARGNPPSHKFFRPPKPFRNAIFGELSVTSAYRTSRFVDAIKRNGLQNLSTPMG